MRAVITIALLTPFFVVGCAPTIAYRIDTRVQADHTCLRRVSIDGRPDKRMPGHRVNLHNYLRLPKTNAYRRAELTPSPDRPQRIVLQGRFASPAEMPADFRKITPGTDRVAGNRVTFRAVDLVLVDVVDYDESVRDIVNRREGALKLDALIHFVLSNVMSAMHDAFDHQYDLRALEGYLNTQVPQVIRRLYTAMWEVRRADRAGIAALSEEEEWRILINSELANLGLRVNADGLPGGARYDEDVWIAFADRQLRRYVRARAEGVPMMTTDTFESSEVQNRLRQAIGRRHGSFNGFLNEIEGMLPEVFGAFIVGRLSVSHMHPRFDFRARLTMPGRLVQTNGVRDFDDSVFWTFDETDMAISGYSMWARSIVVDTEAIAALDLNGFPASIAAIETLYQAIMRAEGEQNPVRQALGICVRQRSLRPLETVAAGQPLHNPGTPPSGRQMDAAQQVLELLREVRDPAPVTDELPIVTPELEDAF